MKLLVLATDPVGADDVRSALPDADLEGSEVLVVSPAVNESPLAFWVSDSDEAIAEAEAVAEQTAASLRDLRVAEVSKLDLKIDGGKVVAFRAKVSLSFKYEA